MKRYTIRTAALLFACCALLGACKKEAQNIFNMFDVTLELHNNKESAAKEYNEVNPNDTLVIDFTIHSPNKDMYMICIWRAGQGVPGIKIPINDPAKRRSYSDAVTIKADQGVGTTTFRVWALDEDGVYLGDGDKMITLSVKTDYKYLPNRSLFLPDTATKKAPSFFSLSKGTSFNYADAAPISADIDFAIYQKFVKNPSPPAGGPDTTLIRCLYTPGADPNPFPLYDLSSWTKRGTLFSAPVSGSAANFTSMFKTGVAIETEAKKRTINLTHYATFPGIQSGQFIYFKTPEGKYGVMLVHIFTLTYDDKPYLNVSIKVQQ
ncbi:hypothetical protein [Paraflavitalea sp. CAU 1676]|uniref:hypothetical protein n=1 Tax=Paraflavitalea sp. CAU 1676 TaxID=3032598 RepID=UPI0023DC116E|nr:hypothetical protein [Paraflavitalea sp. CAU 1676]MDF2191518.1 hypothetical protein [Paraflavitalea sp. CAU 1676]